MRGDGVMHKLFTEFAARYKDREGGYTRILQTRRRPNDCAQMAYIECAPEHSAQFAAFVLEGSLYF